MNVGFPLLRTILESGRLPHLLLYGPSDVMRENLYTLLSEFYPIQPQQRSITAHPNVKQLLFEHHLDLLNNQSLPF